MKNIYAASKLFLFCLIGFYACQNENNTALWKAVPMDAAIVLEIHNRQAYPAVFKPGELEWNAIRDSLALSSHHLAILQSDKSEQADLNWLFVSTFDGKLKSVLTQQYGSKLQSQAYKGQRIFKVPAINFWVTQQQGLCIASKQYLQVTLALEALQQKTPAPVGTADTIAKIHVHPARLHHFLQPFSQISQRQALQPLQFLKGWSSFQLEAFADNAPWQGTSSHSFSRSQSAASPEELYALLPDDIALGVVSQMSPEQIGQLLELPLVDCFTGAIAFGQGTLTQESVEENQFVIAQVTAAASEKLAELQAKGMLTEEQLLNATYYRSRSQQLLLLFEDYLLAFRNEEQMETWLLRMNNLWMNKSISTDLQQLGFTDPSGFLFFDLYALDDTFATLLKPKYYLIWSRFLSTNNSLGAARLDWKSEGNTMSLKGGLIPAAQKENRKLITGWSVDVGSPIESTCPIVNLSPSTIRIFVQDESNTLHCFDDNGDIVWQQKLKGKLQSKINLLQNREGNQYVFNTSNAIYCLNEEGNAIYPPIELQSAASAAMTCIDFDGIGSFTYFVPCENGNLYGYTAQGVPLPNWNPKLDLGITNQPLKHLQTPDKDFLMVCADSLYVFARNGETRFPAYPLKNAPIDFQYHTKSERIVGMDAKGLIHALTLGGKDFRINVGATQSQQFLFLQLIGDERKEYVNLEGNQLKVYGYQAENNSPDLLWAYKFDTSPDQIFQLQVQGKNYIGVLDQKQEKVYLLLPNGTLHPNFPIAATGAFSLCSASTLTLATIFVPNQQVLNTYQIRL